MKTITINGEVFQWTVLTEDAGMDFYDRTVFYKKTKLVPKWTFFKLKSKLMIEEPIVIFSVPFDIRNKNLTKGQLRNKIEIAFELISRGEEIARGELI